MPCRRGGGRCCHARALGIASTMPSVAMTHVRSRGASITNPRNDELSLVPAKSSCEPMRLQLDSSPSAVDRCSVQIREPDASLNRVATSFVGVIPN